MDKDEIVKKYVESVLVKILAELHTTPSTFPERESDEYDQGFQEGLRVARHIIKQKILN